MAGISSKAAGKLENRRKFNDGSEFNTDLGLDWYETAFRGYDPQIGRFHQIDLFSELGFDLSTYLFANNNPVLINDPLGLTGDTVNILLPGVEVTAKKRSVVTPVSSLAQIILPLPKPKPFLPPVVSHPLGYQQHNPAGPLGINWIEMASDISGELSDLGNQAVAQTILITYHVFSLLLGDEKTADEILPGSLKRSPSYNPKYGSKTRSELSDLAKKGDQSASKMKKLIDQVDRLLQKNKGKK